MKRIFSILALTLLVTAASAQTFSVFYTFNFKNGDAPNGGLILDSAGNFYGTTQFGGSSNRGIIFELSPTGQETILYTFTGSTDGGIPIGRLIRDSAGNLYGITSLGGDPTCSCGTVFQLTTTGTLKTLHAFLGGTDGSQNQGQAELGLVMIKGNLYGSASFGGITSCDGGLGCGVLFKVTLAGVETVLYRFTGQADGGFPQDLINDAAGNIYGASGGSYMAGNGGTIFKLDTSGNLSTLYTFPEGAEGTSPRWRLLRTGNGVFYGVTQFGGNTTSCVIGTVGCGVAFSVNAQGKEQVLHTFGEQAGDGAEPSAGLFLADGNGYATTFYGGTVNSTCPFGCGVVARESTKGKYSVIYSFTGADDGFNPAGPLAEDSSGNIYGATTSGGSSGDGVIYKITP
ncbi:MAG TPA: choice-of-anchor tandem repeat GloVer-containing protein [Terriglobales bacterium]|nr:choice-of-anchor tandem repeat GloVer-containing protein [Terriglobales bacterium]